MGGFNTQGAGQGAVGGAMTGASIGGPWGALIGGVAGGAIGGFTGGDTADQGRSRQMLMDYYNSVGGRGAPQAGPAAQSGYSGFRQNQADLISRLEALSKGQGPSLAMQQFQQATDRNVSNQQAMAAGGRGGPLASFNAANNMGMLGANAAQGSAQARIEEQRMALAMLGQNISSGRGADEATNMFNTGQTNETSLANLQARLKSMGLDDSTILGIIGQLQGQNANPNPGMGPAVLAGGAGAMAWNQSQNGQQQSNQGPSMPGGGSGPVTKPNMGWQGNPNIPQRY